MPGVGAGGRWVPRLQESLGLHSTFLFFFFFFLKSQKLQRLCHLGLAIVSRHLQADVQAQLRGVQGRLSSFTGLAENMVTLR